MSGTQVHAGLVVVALLTAARSTLADELTPPLPWRVAAQTEAAIGVGDPFYNHLLGARLQYSVMPEVAIGAYAAYANLKGKSGRAHNVLPAFSIEYRLPLALAWTLPLRYTGGYLPRNGPVVRLSGGVMYRPGPRWDVALDLLAPTLWITQDTPVVSVDLAFEAGLRF